MSEELRFSKIIVPMDFSRPAHRALELARTLAARAGPAHLMLVHAYHVPAEVEAFVADRIPPYLERMSEQAGKDLEAVLADLQATGVSSEYFALHGSPERVILDLAETRGADLIVMGTHGRTGLAHLALGSIAERVVRLAPCPVITIRAAD